MSITKFPTSTAVRDPASFLSAQELPAPATVTVGVVGLGRMGCAFAETLLDAGFAVSAFDRDPVRSQELALVREGAEAAGHLSDLSDCSIVISSLPDDEALSTVSLEAQGLVAILKPGAIHVSMSTVSPELSRRIAKAHADHGQGYVAAPVLGNPDLAGSHRLFVLAAGSSEAVRWARPVLEKLGQRLFVIGEDAGLANVMKLAGNVLTAATLQSMGEVFALLRKAGIDQHLAFDVLTGSLFDGKVHKAYGGKIVDERYDPPGMTTSLAVKDLRLALAEAEGLAVPMPVVGLVHDRLVAMMARGWQGLDWSALGLLAASEAGLSTPLSDWQR